MADVTAVIPEGFEVVNEVTTVVPEGFEVQRFQPEPFEPRNIRASTNIPGITEPRPVDERAGVDPITGNIEGLLTGGSLGFNEEVQSIVGASTAKLIDALSENPAISDKTFGQVMSDIRGNMRERREQFQEQEGLAAVVPEVLGGAVTGIGSVIKTQTPRAALGLAGAEGFAAGVGFADEDEFLSLDSFMEGVAGGVGGLVVGAGINSLQRHFRNRNALKNMIVEQIEEGNPGATAQKIINARPPRALLSASREVVKQGFDAPVTAQIAAASRPDKVKMQAALDIHRKALTRPKFALIHRAGDIVGDSLNERITHLKTVNRQAGRNIDRIAKGLRGQPIDVSQPVQEFAEQLDDWGVRIARGKGGVKIDFSNSSLSPGSHKPIKEVLRQMNRLSQQGTPDALTAHELKRIIDRNVTYGKNISGIDSDVAQGLKSFRRSIDSALDKAYPDYNQANTAYADTINALDMLQDSVGRKLDFSGPNADKALGVALRKLTSNRQGRADLLTAMENAEQIATKHGGTFSDDILDQVLFVNELESVVPPPKSVRTTFQSETAKGTEQAIKGLAVKDQTLLGIAAEKTGETIELLQNVNQDAAMEAMEKLLQVK